MAKLSKEEQVRIARLINAIECSYIVLEGSEDLSTTEILGQRIAKMRAGIALSDEFGIDIVCVDDYRRQLPGLLDRWGAALEKERIEEIEHEDRVERDIARAETAAALGA